MRLGPGPLLKALAKAEYPAFTSSLWMISRPKDTEDLVEENTHHEEEEDGEEEGITEIPGAGG